LNEKLLHTEVQHFIDTNLKTNLPNLVLKGSPFEGITMQELAEQILCKSKCINKLPTYFTTSKIYYPKVVNIEQTSSEVTAQYKSNLVAGKSLIDLTGGFGVDSLFFAKQIQQVTHCEINESLSEIVKYNLSLMGMENIHCVNEDGISYLQKEKINYDWIYIDPSRRNEQKAKVFKLEDCKPDIAMHLDTLLKYTNNVMIKLSPFLDIHATIDQLKFTKEVHIVAVKNEVKELIILIQKGFDGVCRLKTVNIKTEKYDLFEGIFHSEVKSTFSLPKTYLYEPNSAILKAGLFNEVSFQLDIYKLNNNSHLYTSDKLIEFPGRSFKIISIYKYNRKQIKKNFSAKKANITTRNFNESVAQIRKKTGIKEGGDDYLFFTKDKEDSAIMIHCIKV